MQFVQYVFDGMKEVESEKTEVKEKTLNLGYNLRNGAHVCIGNTTKKCLDELTLSQLIMFHRKGWEAKQTGIKGKLGRFRYALEWRRS